MKKFSIALILIMMPIVSNAQTLTIQAIIDSVNIDSLMFRVEEISGERGVFFNWGEDNIYSRNKFRPGNELCFKYIRDKFISYGYQVDSMTFGSNGKNIWAIKPGMVYGNQTVIICAHYDAMPNNAIAPAADDDGSGVAAVLEAARVLAGYDFEYPIVFALWDEEEYSLAGSGAFATAAFNGGDTIHAVFNMDAIAHDSDNDSVARVHARPPGNSEEIADTVIAVNLDYNIGLNMVLVNPGATYSDHQSFWQRNFGAVLLIQDWEGDPNPHYHLVTDLVDYFNIPYFHKLARLTIASAAAFAVPYVTPVGMGIDDEMIESMKLYPNPSNSVINIKWQQEYERIEIVDMLGKVLTTMSIVEGANHTSVDINAFSQGIYFARLVNGKHKVVKKFIKN
jgi:hypothetical protein